MSTATEWQPTADEYHADHSRVSHSMCEVFRRSRKEYFRRFVKQDLPAPEPTPAMRLGSLFHLKVLEPGRFANETAVIPQCDKRTKAGKAEWHKFVEWCKAEGRTHFITREENQLVLRMEKEVLGHPYALKYLMEPGLTEHVATWENDGLQLKARRDYVTASVILDLKTCLDASPGGFAKAVANCGYHRQAAHYMEPEAFCGTQGKPFVFVAVEKQEPFEVGVYTLDEKALALGMGQNIETREALARCLKDHDLFKPLHEKGVAEISLPKFAFYEDEYLPGDAR